MSHIFASPQSNQTVPSGLLPYHRNGGLRDKIKGAEGTVLKSDP